MRLGPGRFQAGCALRRAGTGGDEGAALQSSAAPAIDASTSSERTLPRIHHNIHSAGSAAKVLTMKKLGQPMDAASTPANGTQVTLAQVVHLGGGAFGALLLVMLVTVAAGLLGARLSGQSSHAGLLAQEGTSFSQILDETRRAEQCPRARPPASKRTPQVSDVPVRSARRSPWLKSLPSSVR